MDLYPNLIFDTLFGDSYVMSPFPNPFFNSWSTFKCTAHKLPSYVNLFQSNAIARS